MALYPQRSAFIEALHYSRGSNMPVKRVVIHDMEMTEKGTTAESCAAMFHGSNSPIASAHFYVDSNSVVQGVDTQYIAYHAPPNTGSIGIEHAGYANQSMTSWLDDYGKAMIAQSARLVAWLCGAYDIPARWLTQSQLAAGQKGICTHADVSATWHKTDHTDPGTGFPKNYYLSAVQAVMNGNPISAGEPDMAVTDAEVTSIANAAADAVWSRFAVHVAQGGDVINGTPGLLTLQHVLGRIADDTHAALLLDQAAAGGTVDVHVLATALAALLPTTLNVDPAALATAVADKIHDRLAS